jgi:adenylate kinase
MKIILLGAPGAGKGTQAESLQRELGLPHVASGDLFRDAFKKGTSLGLQAKSFMDKGELVPDKVVIDMILERLSQPDCKMGVILDGFPRTVEQAKALDEELQKAGDKIDSVLYFKVPVESLLERLSGRFICRQCQTPYHSVFSPPKQAGICDKCGGELYQRDDDRRETVENRLKVYFSQTEPVIMYYNVAGLLKEIDGDQKAEDVARDALAHLAKTK